jgi:hypothetical protein
MAVPTTIRTGPRSTELDGLDKAIDSHPIWTELRGPDSTLLCGYHHREHPTLGWTSHILTAPHTGPHHPGSDPTQTPRRNRTHEPLRH